MWSLGPCVDPCYVPGFPVGGKVTQTVKQLLSQRPEQAWEVGGTAQLRSFLSPLAAREGLCSGTRPPAWVDGTWGWLWVERRTLYVSISGEGLSEERV